MFSLSFLSPAFLAGAAAAAVPIFLHLFRRQAEPRIPFSAIRFLRHAPVEEARRRRLRELLLLALRVAALALLALAFARPYWTSAMAGPGAVTVVAVDTSFSMSAPGQFERARRLAAAAIAHAPAAHLVGVVAFSDSADVIQPPSADRDAALSAIQGVTPGFGATRYGAALAGSAQMIGRSAGRIIVVTDLEENGWDGDDRGALPARIAVEVADAGAPESNLAALDVRRDPAGAIGLIQNNGPLPRSGTARLLVNGRRVDERPFAVGPGASAEVTFDASLPGEGIASFAIDDALGYAADNTRFLLLDPPPPARLMVVTLSGQLGAEGFYLGRALRLGAETAFDLTTMSGGQVSTVTAGDLKPYAAVLLLSTRGIDHRGRDTLLAYVWSGGGLFVTGGPDVESDVLEQMLGSAFHVRIEPDAAPARALSFAASDTRHPIFRTFGPAAGNLGAVRVTRTIRVSENAGEVLARFSDGTPALVEYHAGQGRVLLFGSDLNNRWNDFPLHPMFVPFVYEAAKYVTAARQDPRDYLMADLPQGVARTPGPVLIPTRAAASGASGAAGSSRLSTRRSVANVDTRESALSRLTADRFTAPITRMNDTAAARARSEAKDVESRQRLWQYALVLMVAGLVAEGLLGGRIG